MCVCAACVYSATYVFLSPVPSLPSLMGPPGKCVRRKCSQVSLCVKCRKASYLITLSDTLPGDPHCLFLSDAVKREISSTEIHSKKSSLSHLIS